MTIPYGRQWIDEADEQAVLAVLRSDFLTQGPAVERFEAALADYVGARFCVAVANATAGLHLAYAALGLGPGDEGVTTPITFVATANAMEFLGARVRFSDIDGTSFNLDPHLLEQALSPATRVIAPVHFAGVPADMQAIEAIARRRGIPVVEDASHAIGGRYPTGEMIGACARSAMTVFSFHPVKTITTGEGGAVTTNDPRLYEKLRDLRAHGITRDPSRLVSHPGPWYYEMQDLGYNYRMTEMQAALGCSQLRRLDDFRARRQAIIAAYDAAFGDLAWFERPLTGEGTCCHLYVGRFDFAALGRDRAGVMQRLREAGVGTQVHYIPVHLQPWYRERYGHRAGDFPVAEAYYQRCLSLPLFPRMTDEEVARVIEAVRALT
ncbi:UDP-4-amino-4,6-dideoxy-N-acetyl-beta-L-altrosamine transaminase [Zavarzinia sp.]|uniref:UDP-4-amino-4, 6-dideoxy-N-acetyl-beta-L-altrosamine transaminase n=1 Tax=Zavarzinia sp. TaxID=2027920 RepID=UPI0035661112